MIPYSCLEYGMGVTGWKRYLFFPNLWSSGTWNSLTWLAFSCVNMSYFITMIYEYLYWLLWISYGWFVMVSIMVICWLYVGYMMYSYYEYCSWFDKLLDSWWMHGLTSVIAVSYRGHRSFLVILKWRSEVYDQICIHDLYLICLSCVWRNVYLAVSMYWSRSCSSLDFYHFYHHFNDSGKLQVVLGSGLEANLKRWHRSRNCMHKTGDFGS